MADNCRNCGHPYHGEGEDNLCLYPACGDPGCCVCQCDNPEHEEVPEVFP
jgi:hypothetical protein